MATVELKNVKKSFGATEVIHGVNMDISDGEFFVDDPKITNRGNDRVIRLAQYQSAD